LSRFGHLGESAARADKRFGVDGQIGVTEFTYYRWRKEYGGLQTI
jgi:hypothetical protein